MSKSNFSSVVSIDPGNLVSGIVLVQNGSICHASISANDTVFDLIQEVLMAYDNVTVVVEDIKPYQGVLSQYTIDTCKFIGELCFRIKQVKADCLQIPRATVRKWIYSELPDVILPLVQEKIEKRNKKNNDGKLRSPSFIYVDDSMVIKAMKDVWGIPSPKPGKGYEYGLMKHSWQALALATFFLSQK